MCKSVRILESAVWITEHLGIAHLEKLQDNIDHVLTKFKCLLVLVYIKTGKYASQSHALFLTYVKALFLNKFTKFKHSFIKIFTESADIKLYLI